jgi:hypothetical protein
VNINGLPMAAHKEKHDRITTTIEKQKIDISEWQKSI